MAQSSGFFDALENNGVYDRTYSAADYCDNLAAVIKTGVVKDSVNSNNDLAVSANSDMSVAVSPGRAWINGHYYYNDTELELDISTAPVTNSRIDRVVLRLDTSTATRSIVAAVKTGSAAATPTPPELTREGDIYEICLANIIVNNGISAMTSGEIIDTRNDNNVCGWAASVSPSVLTLLQQFVWNETLTAAAQTVAFNIPQYRTDVAQIVNVYTNGVLEVAGVDYTLNENIITFTNEKAAGTEITVVLQKSVDTENIESIVGQIIELQNQVAALESDNEYIYKCNGIDDNVALSQFINSLLSELPNAAATVKVRVIGGNFKIANAIGGAGTIANPKMYFYFGRNADFRVIIDFANAGQINVPIAAGTYNHIFTTFNCNCIIENADVVANQTGANTSIIMFDPNTPKPLLVRNSRFWINASIESYIAESGTFENCRGSVTTGAANVYCFKGSANGLLRVQGGEYYAYNSGSNTNAVIFNSQSNAVIILYGVNCPMVSRSGYQQINAILSTAGKVSITDTITTLTVSATGANIRGTLAINKNGLM